MRQSPRRAFLKTAGLGAAAIAMHGRSILGAESRRVVMGIIGTGGMGSNHVQLLSKRSDVEVAYVCDVDEKRLAGASRDVNSASGKTPKAVKDLRKVLDDSGIDAVLIATPDHWHAPASILALEAGKHVYVEKPCSHNIREGRLMVEAARKAGKSLQVGTQSRSTPVIQEGIERIRSGEIGEVLVAKAWNSQLRSTIGKTQPGDPPADLDFDLWLGPAPTVPFRSNMLHSIWRWWHDFGCGDIGNDGVHDIDVARWGLGVERHPNRVACLGGKYFFDDDQQFPDTQYAGFEYEPEGGSGRKKQLIFEQRIWSPYVQEGYENGAAFYGTNGVLVMGHSVGWKLYGPGNKLILEKTGSPDLPAHHTNFLASLRGEAKKLNADAMTGHLSATLVHLANIAVRVGRVLRFDPGTEEIARDDEAGLMVRRKYREGHWAVPKGV